MDGALPCFTKRIFRAGEAAGEERAFERLSAAEKKLLCQFGGIPVSLGGIYPVPGNRGSQAPAEARRDL